MERKNKKIVAGIMAGFCVLSTQSVLGNFSKLPMRGGNGLISYAMVDDNEEDNLITDNGIRYELYIVKGEDKPGEHKPGEHKPYVFRMAKIYSADRQKIYSAGRQRVIPHTVKWRGESYSVVNTCTYPSEDITRVKIN